MASSTSRLRTAPDDYSGMGLAERRARQRQKAPLAHYGAVLMFAASGHGARRHHTAVTNEGASSMAKTTRGPSPYGSRTRQTGVKITPPTQPGPATTTSSTR